MKIKTYWLDGKNGAAREKMETDNNDDEGEGEGEDEDKDDGEKDGEKTPVEEEST